MLQLLLLPLWFAYHLHWNFFKRVKNSYLWVLLQWTKPESLRKKHSNPSLLFCYSYGYNKCWRTTITSLLIYTNLNQINRKSPAYGLSHWPCSSSYLIVIWPDTRSQYHGETPLYNLCLQWLMRWCLQVWHYLTWCLPYKDSLEKILISESDKIVHHLSN